MSSAASVIKELIRQQLLTLHTCLICKVLEAYDDGTAKVHPLTMVQTTAGEVRQHGALDHVPVLDHVKSSLKAGSICVVVFAERDIAGAISGEYTLPSAARHHSLSDGVIVGTIGETVTGGISPELYELFPGETDTTQTVFADTERGKEIQVDVKLNKSADNLLQADSDGLYAPGYTKKEIDEKDNAVKKIADEARTTAENVRRRNSEQDNLLAELAKIAHTHSNQAVLDETTAPFTEADKIKLDSLTSASAPMQYHSYTNDSEITVKDEQQAQILQMRYTSKQSTHLSFFAEIKLHLETTEASDEGSYTCGDGLITAVYCINGKEIGKTRPQWTLQDGVHTIHLFFHFSATGAETKVFSVNLTARGCTVSIEPQEINAMLEGTYLAGEEAWDGLIEAADTFGLLPLSESSPMIKTVQDTVSAAVHQPVQNDLADSLMPLTVETAEITI